jgi:hypothetical protein
MRHSRQRQYSEEIIMTRAFAILAILICVQHAATGQEKPSAPSLNLTVVFERIQSEKRVASVPYTLSLIADGRASRVRMGIQVPLTGMRGQDANAPAGNVVYRSLGNSVECAAEPREDGRFGLTCSFEQMSVYNGDPQPAGSAAAQTFPFAPPVLRAFTSETRMILGNGDTRQHVTGTDPVNGDVLRIAVTLAVVK